MHLSTETITVTVLSHLDSVLFDAFNNLLKLLQELFPATRRSHCSVHRHISSHRMSTNAHYQYPDTHESYQKSAAGHSKGYGLMKMDNWTS